MQDIKVALFPAETPREPRTAGWKPYEGQPFWSLERYRNRILIPAIAKRHFFLARINLVGLTIFEIIIALALVAVGVVVGAAQRTSEAEASGSGANILWVPLFLFVTYRSVITWIFGISFERGMFWHAFLSFLATAYGIWHGICAMYWAELDNDDGGKPVRGLAAFTRGEQQGTFITGALASLFMTLLIITSLHPIRRYMRRAWLWSHHLLVIPAAVFSIIHGGALVIAGLIIYLADRLFGYLYQAWIQYRKMGEEGKAEILESGLIRLSFPRLAHFTAGQFMCIQVPRVSIFEYHAFTIASIPSDNELTFLIQPMGFWSKNLAKRIKQDAGGSCQEVPIRAFLHGPIGSVALDWQSKRYQAFILVAGGIGVTPMISIYRHLSEQRRRGRPLVLAQLIWSARSKQLVDDVVESQILSKGNPRQAIKPEGEDSAEAPGMEAKIFLTKAGQSEDYPLYADDESKEREVLGRVQWHAGRPQLKALFMGVRDVVEAEGLKRVAVLACGPGALTKDVCSIAGKVGNRAVAFDVHLEHFY